MNGEILPSFLFTECQYEQDSSIPIFNVQRYTGYGNLSEDVVHATYLDDRACTLGVAITEQSKAGLLSWCYETRQ